MKFTGLAMVILMAANAWARDAKHVTPDAVACMDADHDQPAVLYAMDLATKIFRKADVTLAWSNKNRCPYGAIKITLRSEAPAWLDSNALAYALPYEGTHIVVFSDRMRRIVNGHFAGPLMGHVLAHEIGHILEGVTRHSDSGVMKATFNFVDQDAMQARPYSFAEEDVWFIHQGLAARMQALNRLSD